MGTMNNNMEQRRLLMAITEVGFEIDDALLYLDTHPCDTKALAKYHEFKCEYDRLVEQYVENFGPLNKTQVLSGNYFTWVSDPWPWEGVEC